MRKLVIFFLFHFTSLVLCGQVLMNKDSLLRLLPQAKEDTDAVQLYINIGQQYESNEPNVAKMYYKKAGDLSRKLNYPKGVIKYINNYTFVLNVQGLYDSSLLLNLKAVALSREIQDTLNLGKTLFNTGISYWLGGENESAVQYYEEAKKILEKTGDEVTEGKLLDFLQVLYFDLRRYDEAIQTGEQAVSLLRRLNDPSIATSLNNLGLNYLFASKIDKAESCFKEALDVSIEMNNKDIEQNIYLNLATVQMKRGDFIGMKPYADRALTLARQLESHEGELIALRDLSYVHQFNKQYDMAERYAKEALAISHQYNLRVERQKMLDYLSTLAYSMQDMKLAEEYATQSGLLGDSILNEAIERNTQELEKKYETEKKENQIRQLESNQKVRELTLQRRKIFNFALLTGILVVSIISLLSYRTYKQKQKLQYQRIAELETEKHLAATEAVLKGEEKERSRIAKDLHDGLGGMLSGLKYSFRTMKDNLVMTPENQQAFERSMDMLDSSIKEMRRVAHNMMPESLLRFGLDTALKDFCNDINQSGALQVNYQSIRLADAQLDHTTAITVYRVVQELINNVLKHAGAKTAIVQVSTEGKQLSVTVEDDGKGFDTSILDRPSGIGWSNINSRIEFLKGKLDINSAAGKGTSVLIEVPV